MFYAFMNLRNVDEEGDLLNKSDAICGSNAFIIISMLLQHQIWNYAMFRMQYSIDFDTTLWIYFSMLLKPRWSFQWKCTRFYRLHMRFSERSNWFQQKWVKFITHWMFENRKNLNSYVQVTVREPNEHSRTCYHMKTFYTRTLQHLHALCD